MPTLQKPNLRTPLSVCATILAISVCLPGRSLAADTGHTNNVPSQSTSGAASKLAGKKSQKKPTGAELYALHCNRCHPERYAPERTAEQWQTILLHMRTRANLPAAQAREILHYLQEQSGK